MARRHGGHVAQLWEIAETQLGPELGGCEHVGRATRWAHSRHWCLGLFFFNSGRMFNSVFEGTAEVSRKGQVLVSEDNDLNPVSTSYGLSNTGKAPNFFEPLCPHLCNGEDASIHLKALTWIR